MRHDVVKRIFLLTTAVAISMSVIYAQAVNASKTAADKYKEVVTGRADKIVKTLDIKDPAKYNEVRDRIAQNYIDLNKQYAARDTLLKIAKANTADKTILEAEKAIIEAGTTGQVAIVHNAFVSDLSKNLNEEQLGKVKDGLTYDVLHVTYTAYQDMIPSLTKTQKDQIYAWLLEAREHAMDGESSDKKHWWFGKYKGRINNYLSAEGYDLQAERAAWEKRLADSKEKRN